jgi:competence protein ComEC
MLYDAGAITGPDVARRIIAPYLWHRGITHIDELFLSHADLDHFNGVPALLERFAIERVLLTPSFDERQTPAARIVLEALRRHRPAVVTVSAGHRLQLGDLSLEVLHPPATGPPGKENARSMVLSCEIHGRSILLTGDLEQAGLANVLAMPPRRVDVLMAPHHGSKMANTPALAAWANPRFVVSCQGAQWRLGNRAEPYTNAGAYFLPTWPHGMVEIRCQDGSFVVTTHRTKLHLRT